MTKQFYIAGVQFHDLPKIIDEVEVGEVLSLEPDPTNQYDSTAVKILRGDTFIGFVPGKLSAEVTLAMRMNDLICTVVEVNPTAKPWTMCAVKIEEKVDAPA